MLTQRLADSRRLRQRRLELLPLRGDGAAFTDVQGRQPDESSSPMGLADLISSIATVGVLQAVLVEEVDGDDGSKRRLLVAGERRYRAARWGAANMPDNAHFAAIPAIICPGPLTEEERRIWQLVENLAREPLQPGELASALMLERCAIIAGKLETAGRAVPADLLIHPEPIERFRALERLRDGDPDLSAPWELVLRRLGLQLSARKARQLVAAFRELPAELSAEMDEQKIMLNTRIRFARLRRGRRDAADEIWAAVKARGRPQLLASAITAASPGPNDSTTKSGRPGLDAGLDATAAVDHAVHIHAQANAARAAKLTAPHNRQAPSAADLAELTRSPVTGPAAATHEAGDDPGLADPHLVEAALTGLKSLLNELRDGRNLSRYDTGSLQLLLTELSAQLAAALDTSGGQADHDAVAADPDAEPSPAAGGSTGGPIDGPDRKDA